MSRPKLIQNPHVLAVRIEPKLFAALDKKAKSEHRTVSDIVRSVIREFLLTLPKKA